MQTQQLDAVHLALCAASSVIPAPSSPDGRSEALRCPKDIFACGRPGGVGLPGFGVLLGRDDCSRTAGGDGVVTLADIEGSNGCDLLLLWDLVEQLGLRGGISALL